MISTLFIAATSLLGFVASESCIWRKGWPARIIRKDCDYGCCYEYIDPCCLKPFYAYSGFITGIVFAGIACVSFLCVICMIIQRRKRLAAARLAVGYNSQPYAVSGQVVSTTTTTNPSAPPAYAGSPPPYSVVVGPGYNNNYSTNYGPNYGPNYFDGSAPGYSNQGFANSTPAMAK